MCGVKDKKPAMKIKNLVIKNELFGETHYEFLTQEIQNCALPLLMLIVMKRSGDLKSRGCANGSYQKICTDKSE